ARGGWAARSRGRCPPGSVAGGGPARGARRSDGPARGCPLGAGVAALRRGRARGGLPAGRRAGTAGGWPDRPDRGPRLGDLDLPPSRGDGPRSGAQRAIDAGRVPGCDRHEPALRSRDPRGPRSAGDPGAHVRGAHPRAARAAPQRGPCRVRDMRTAIVLAGGRSARFGGDKLAQRLNGEALVERAIDAVASVADEVIVAGRAIEAIKRTVRAIPDDEPFGRPLVALVGALGPA